MAGSSPGGGGEGNPEFHVYLMDNVRQGDPNQFRLIDLHGETPVRLLQRAKVSAYDLACRSVYDLTCRSRRGDHGMGSPPVTRLSRSLSR